MTQETAPAPPEPMPRRFSRGAARILRAVRRHRVAAGIAAALVLAGGLGATFLWPVEHEASLVVTPLEHEFIVYDWLGSRQAASFVVGQVGDPLVEALAHRPPLDAVRPQGESAAALLQDRVEVRILLHEEDAPPRFVVSARMHDARLAREVARGYADSLGALRPHLDALERGAAFREFYDGTNEAAALASADVAVRQGQYWLVIDEPSVAATTPVSPLLGSILAVLAAALAASAVAGVLEWWGDVRSEYAATAGGPAGGVGDEGGAGGAGGAPPEVDVEAPLPSRASLLGLSGGGADVPRIELRVMVVDSRQAESP